MSRVLLNHLLELQQFVDVNTLGQVKAASTLIVDSRANKVSESCITNERKQYQAKFGVVVKLGDREEYHVIGCTLGLPTHNTTG